MFNSVINAFKTKELRRKILYTIFLLIIFRLGEFITVPGVNKTALQQALGNYDALGFMDMISGGGLSQMSVLAMSITPYINSSIIMQLLTVAIPALERIARDGDEGRKKIAQYTRYLTIILAFIQSTGMYFGFTDLIENRNALSYLTVILSLTAGTAFLMWLGEKITENGIGNGISLIIFAGIVSRFPSIATTIYENIKAGSLSYIVALIFVVVLVVVFGFIVLMNDAERRIPVQYAKRVVGRKMYGGQSTHMPIKVNMSGVLPIIFASSILSLPGTVQMFLSSSKYEGTFWEKFFKAFQSDSWWYAGMYFILIIFFAYFYSTIQYNPIEMANNLRKNNGVIPGIRPGRPTSDYILKIISRLTLIGALMISVVALFPIVYSLICDAAIKPLPDAADSTGGMSITMGGTSLIILVGVALETVRQLESQMMMRHYKGFLD